MATDPYEDLKRQYRAAWQSGEAVEARVAKLERLKQQLREFCIADGKDLRELEAWFAKELEEWASYGGA